VYKIKIVLTEHTEQLVKPRTYLTIISYCARNTFIYISLRHYSPNRA
jgi:hypothetical protein